MTAHPDPRLVQRYAAAGTDLDSTTVWSIESHLETCASCRALLGPALPPEPTALLERVERVVADRIAVGPAPAAPRWAVVGRFGIVLALLPWLATIAGVLGVAVLSELVYPDAPSLTLLVAPVVPLLPVALAWSRGADPAWEIVASTPRAGLRMLLHRTLLVLAAVIPLLAVAGTVSGHNMVLWLLPCLAFTAGSVALGGLIGVVRATVALAAAWTAIVIVPSLATGRLPALLEQANWPVWSAVIVALFVTALLRAGEYGRLASRR
ncbi:hypothetical protein [Salinispora arenicola]|uniref:hypothetical protein n=1 Tax=Salinispora arenicola TaxID=168697 RepID=UPI00035FC4F0|nr:hypothetical protein [Salinispora arenicola]